MAFIRDGPSARAAGCSPTPACAVAVSPPLAWRAATGSVDSAAVRRMTAPGVLQEQACRYRVPTRCQDAVLGPQDRCGRTLTACHVCWDGFRGTGAFWSDSRAQETITRLGEASVLFGQQQCRDLPAGIGDQPEAVLLAGLVDRHNPPLAREGFLVDLQIVRIELAPVARFVAEEEFTREVLCAFEGCHCSGVATICPSVRRPGKISTAASRASAA